MNDHWGADADPTAQGRIKGARPVAVLDIGSNSVRLVVYERHARALTPLYNEKTACALGQGVASDGRLDYHNIDRALTAIQRFALVTRLMRVGTTHIIATAAVREASNSSAFVAAVEEIMGGSVAVLSGTEEAHFAALGVTAGIPGFTGVIGDLGGGSLELSAMETGQDESGETHELGVIRLRSDADGDAAAAARLARDRLLASRIIASQPGGTFCAIGGSWRALAKVHQALRRYPLRMVQNYEVPAEDLLQLCDEITDAMVAGEPIPGGERVSSARRDLLPFGAAVMAEVLRAGNFETVVFSALGVREGYLYERLDPEEKAIDPLLQASEEMSVLRSRSPGHAADLIAFTDGLLGALGVSETPAERRLRRVACNLADISWRGHPDYRGEQSIDLIAYGSFTGLDHPGRAFLAEVLAVRYMGLKFKSVSKPLLELSGAAGHARARLLGAAFRVAYPMSAAMPGVLPRTGFTMEAEKLILQLPEDLAFLDGEHLRSRLDQLAGVAGIKTTEVRTGQ
ncbi:MAG TPA: Ppx/GppA phosphatase family protein [Devosiaceae bacterium]|nr:Ppx/GppA phosphatase family protein [Devosiaceae bacterium]